MKISKSDMTIKDLAKCMAIKDSNTDIIPVSLNFGISIPFVHLVSSEK